MRRTDNGVTPRPASAYRLPDDGQLPDLPLYKRLIGDGIAAADSQGTAVDQKEVSWTLTRQSDAVRYPPAGRLRPRSGLHGRIGADPRMATASALDDAMCGMSSASAGRYGTKAEPPSSAGSLLIISA